MSSTFKGLGIGISAAFAQQRALDVTGHNISNVNTPGYTRQMISHTSRTSQTIGRSGNGVLMQSGTGVDVQEIRQYRDAYLDAKLKKENCSLGYWKTRQSGIEELEGVFNDSSEDGLQTVMDSFWNSWEQLTKPAGGLTTRALVKENAIAFVETVKNMDMLLTNFRINKDREISDSVKRINDIAKQIAGLNMEIKKVENHGVTANDLRDQRENLINELSGTVKIQVFETSRSLNIALEGRLLVEDNQYDEIALKADAGNSGFVKLSWKNSDDPVNFGNGSLRSLFETRDELVHGFREKLDELVKGVVTEINAVHITGYGIKDNVQRYFFINANDESGNGINISNLAFNPELNEFDNIASAKEPFNIEDNSIAVKIAELRLKDVFSSQGYETNEASRKFNYDEFYRNILAELGNKGQEAVTAAGSQQVLVEQIEYRRQAVSSVSIDEEMSNLIRYEYSYNAAARIVNVMDEMLDIVVNKIGLVGR